MHWSLPLVTARRPLTLKNANNPMPLNVKVLKECVAALEADPALLHQGDLGFFRKYLEGLGAKLPAPKKQDHARTLEVGI